MYVCTREGILKSGPFNVQSKLGFLLQVSRQTNISEIFSLNCALHQMWDWWLCRLCSRCYIGHTHFAILENCLLTMSNIFYYFSTHTTKVNHMYFWFWFQGQGNGLIRSQNLHRSYNTAINSMRHYEPTKVMERKVRNYSYSCFGDKMCL